ncbi:MAG: exodeoxyribonuclease VII large subunit [Geminicoccaceae bacterium]|nr:exodeoxyribonuclease VII large subunit [Geminicoccaceae bacterium]
MASNVHEYTVSEISFALKRTVEDAFGLVRVRGEISGFKRAASGHLYFALKDDKSVLDGVCWRGSATRLAFKPEDGLEVICTGKLTTYPGRSRYQLVIEHMEPAGAGALMALFEERKRRLEAEGLFDPARKRPLPFLPEIIGIVTSPTGSVIRDMLHRLAERFPRRVVLWPVAVQGEGAAEQIAAAIRGFPRVDPRPDLLIVARGGGSIEDLWAFNEEVVARAVADCDIPLISAVGHETDTTLIDHVADRRAPTPTAAAEIAVPVRRELAGDVAALGERMEHAVHRMLDHAVQRVQGLARGLPDPAMLMGIAAQRFDDLSERLRLRTPLLMLEERREQMTRRHQRIGELARDRIRACERSLAGIPDGRIAALVDRRIHDETARLGGLSKLLESLGHRQVLERGYALVHRPADGGLISSRADAEREGIMEIEFRDGRVKVMRGGETPPARRSARRGSSEPFGDQGTLL